MSEMFKPTFIILKNKRRLMMLPCSLCVYVSRPLIPDNQNLPCLYNFGADSGQNLISNRSMHRFIWIRVISMESRRIILPRTSFSFINYAIWALRNTDHPPQECCSNLIRFPLRKSQADLKEWLDASVEQLNNKDCSFHMHDVVLC
jgi:hypothetical protein